jgi:hypothetical protein
MQALDAAEHVPNDGIGNELETLINHQLQLEILFLLIATEVLAPLNPDAELSPLVVCRSVCASDSEQHSCKKQCVSLHVTAPCAFEKHKMQDGQREP